MFIFASDDHRLGKSDAEFVDVIHTDILQRGILYPSGHADFYANGGIEQPGCNRQINQSKKVNINCSECGNCSICLIKQVWVYAIMNVHQYITQSLLIL